MKNLKLYEEFEGNDIELDDDQDFDVEVEFHEFINDWEKEHAIPMTKQELKLQFSMEAIESIMNQLWDRENKTEVIEVINSKLEQLAEIDSPLSKFFDMIKTKYDWYNDTLAYAILCKIYTMILSHDEAEDIEWSQDDEDYMSVAGEEEDDNDIDKLRKTSMDRYAKEDEDERKEDEIYSKVKQGMSSGQKYQLSKDEEDYLQSKANKFLKRYENRRIINFRNFKS